MLFYCKVLIQWIRNTSNNESHSLKMDYNNKKYTTKYI